MHAVIFDLHTHTDASDGSLTPNDLLILAARNGVDVLSITDHDTVAAYDRVRADLLDRVRLVRGIELSTTWRGRGIHVVGLNIELHSPVLREGIRRQQAARYERARIISRKLNAFGLDTGFADVQAIAGGNGIGRQHFARHLIDIGAVKDAATAFRKYLGAGKAGDVKTGWASLEEVVDWIRAAGGIAVLAHPAKYKLTWTKLRLLLGDFVAIGGQAIEVVCGPQKEIITRRLASLAVDFDLMASSGSDFHHPELPWSAPGRFPRIPGGLSKVSDSW